MEFQIEKDRIYAMKEDQLMAEITFPSINEHRVNIEHTYVHQDLRGQHIAGLLMEAAIEEIRRQGKDCVPTCSYAIAWFEKHPDAKKELVKK